MKKLTFIVLGIVILLLGLIVQKSKPEVSAANPCSGNERDNGCACSNNNQCASNFCSNSICSAIPTNTPTSTPTSSPTPTLQSTSTPTPTVIPTSVPEPTSTPTPTIVPIEIVKLDLTGGNGFSPTFPHDEGVSRNECHGSVPKAPILTAKRINPTTVKYFWWPMDNINHFSLIYGYKSENEMGVPSIVGNANEITVSELSSNSSVFGRLWAEQADYCGNWSQIVKI